MTNMPTTTSTAAQIERRRSAYEAAKKALISACHAHLRTIAKDAELCAAIAHKERTPVSEITKALQRLPESDVEVSDSANIFGEPITYGAALSVFVFEGRLQRQRHRWSRVVVPLGAITDPVAFTEWRAKMIGREKSDRLSKARELCRERREINALIHALPSELQLVALGKKG